jgi:excinuclease UvrABC nuclease subunit
MDNAAKDLNFSAAAKYRDEFFAIEQVIKEKKANR